MAAGVAVVVAVLLATATAKRAFGSATDVFDSRVDLQIFGIGHSLDERVLRSVRYLPGVALAWPVVEGDALAGTEQAPELLDVRGTDLLQPLPGVSEFIERAPTPLQPRGTPFDMASAIVGRGAIVSADLARRLHLNAGSTFTVRSDGRSFALRVASIFSPQTVGNDSRAVFVDVGTAQTLFARGAVLDRIDCVVPADVSAVRARIAPVLPAGARVALRDETPAAPARFLPYLATQLTMLACIVFCIGMAIVYDGIGTAVERRAGDIATLRTLGASRAALFRTFLFEGLGYGAIGSLAGIAGGAYAARWLVWSLAGSGTTAQQVHVAFDGVVELAAFVGGTAAATLAAAAAARTAMHVGPVAAMAAGGGESRGKVRTTLPVIAGIIVACLAAIWFACHDRAATPYAGYAATAAVVLAGAAMLPWWIRLVGAAGFTPLGRAIPAVRVALGTFRAYPRRLAIATGSIALAMSAVAGFAIASASFGGVVEAWAAETFSGDLVVNAERNDGLGDASDSLAPALRERIRRVTGVARVDGTRSLSVTYGNDAVLLRGDDALDAPSSPQARPSPGPQRAFVTVALARRMRVRAGDVFPLPSPTGRVLLRVAALRAWDVAQNGAITVSRRVIVQRYGDDRFDALRIATIADSNLAAVRSRIARTLRLEPVRIATTAELRDRALQLARSTMLVVSALSGICMAMGLFGVAGTATALVYDRRQEFALLRYLGATRDTVRTIVLVETSVWTIFGSAIGLLCGSAIAAVQLALVDGTALDSAIPFRVPISSLVVALFTTLLAALFAASFPASRALRISATKTRDAL